MSSVSLVFFFSLLILLLPSFYCLSKNEILERYPHSEDIISAIRKRTLGYDPIDPSGITFNTDNTNGVVRLTLHSSHHYRVDEYNFPENPWSYDSSIRLERGRKLPRWGPNYVLVPVVLKEDHDIFKVLVMERPKKSGFALPSSIVEFEGIPKHLIEFIQLLPEEQQGPFIDAWDHNHFLSFTSPPSYINTKNSWLEAEVFYCVLNATFDVDLVDTKFHWVEITPDLNLFMEHLDYVNGAISVERSRRTAPQPEQTSVNPASELRSTPGQTEVTPSPAENLPEQHNAIGQAANQQPHPKLHIKLKFRDIV